MSEVEQIEENLRKLKKLGVSETEIIKRYESKILSLKNGELSYVFIKNIKGADVKAHGNAIIESKNARWNYEFALDIKGADVKAHGKAVIESKEPECNYYFARYVKGADVMAHGRVIIESKDSRVNDWFKKNFEDEYKILKENNLIDNAYNFIDDALDEMIKENNEENKSMQKRS